MNVSVKKYYFFCYRNRQILKKKIKHFSRLTSVSEKIAASYEIMDFALVSGAGYYTIPEIEGFYIGLAKTIKTPKKQTVVYPNSYLHVMTKAYPTGGHSRVVARWIATSSLAQKHSVILLNQENVPIPQDIQDAVISHNGELYVSEKKDIIENAAFLREISLQYEGVILHIHPNDPTAIIAYGSSSFKTPVLLFNHADHNYWCGASIVDVIADIRDNGISQKYRNINDVFVLRIPMESTFHMEKYITPKAVARSNLNISQESKVIVTIGRSIKYKPLGAIEFCSIIQDVLEQVPHSLCFGIGPRRETGNWNVIQNCIAVGEITYGEEYYKYLAAADLYIDSIPMGGGVAIMDAVQVHVPVLSYTVFDPDFGSLVEGVFKITRKKIFVTRAVELLLDDVASEHLANEQYQMMIKRHGQKEWVKRRDVVIDVLKTKVHTVTQIQNVSAPIDDRCVMNSIERLVTSENRSIESSNRFLREIKRLFYYFWDKI